MQRLRSKIAVRLAVEKQVLEFLLDRARFVLKERDGLAYDEINAALAAGADDLVDAVRRMEAIRAIRKTKNFEPLAVSFKRIRKILEKAGPESGWKLSAVRSELFAEEAERELHARAAAAVKEAEQHKRAGRYREALQEIAELAAGGRPVFRRGDGDGGRRAGPEKSADASFGAAFGVFDDRRFLRNRRRAENGEVVQGT